MHVNINKDASQPFNINYTEIDENIETDLTLEKQKFNLEFTEFQKDQDQQQYDPQDANHILQDRLMNCDLTNEPMSWSPPNEANILNTIDHVKPPLKYN